MSQRRLLLLSPYRMPTNHQIHLSEDEVAAWLHGYLMLWHPALLHNAGALPAVASAYDHDKPEAGDLFAVPDSPPLYQADIWKDLVVEAGALAFTPAVSWESTQDSYRHALAEVESRWPDNPAHNMFRDAESQRLWDIPEEILLQFIGLGFGFLVVDSLFEAMEHENLLDKPGFWEHVCKAVAELANPSNPEALQVEIQAAAGILLQARETLYPSKMALLDFWDLKEDSIDDLTAALQRGDRLTMLASGHLLERHGAKLRPSVQYDDGTPRLSILIGGSVHREEAILPLESQFWNLRTGIRQSVEHIGIKPVGYASASTNIAPQMPSILKEHGLNYAWLTTRDGSILPSHHSAVVNWPGPDGKSIEGLSKASQPAQEVSTYFNLAYLLHQSISADTMATLVLLHTLPKAPLPYRAWRSLSRVAPVLGEWLTVGEYFKEAIAGEYAGVTKADEIFLDYLEQRTSRSEPHPASAFADFHQDRRRIDGIHTFRALLHVLNRGSAAGSDGDEERKFEVERLHASQENPSPKASFEAAAGELANRLQASGSRNEPGWMFMNPLGFTRRAAVELTRVNGPLAVEGAIKAADYQNGTAKVVVEVPPLGYAWIANKPAAKAPNSRFAMTEGKIIRNEFVEAEVDPATGGLRGLRDSKTKVNRVGQQIVFNPGSKMIAQSVEIQDSGPVVARIVSKGTLQNDHNEVLAEFTQTLELWLTRPVLLIKIDLVPREIPQGYPWHTYYAARFAWRDDRAALLRGVNGMACATTHNRPQTPDYLELRSGKSNTCIFPGGLPFHQKSTHRMIDTILIPPGEKETSFAIHIALDRENPQQTALSLLSEVAVLPSDRGQPAAGPGSWLFHVDSSNLILTSMRPAGSPNESEVAVILQFVEAGGIGGLTEIRCVRNPVRAFRIDGLDEEQHELGCSGDAVTLEYSAHEMPRICVVFN